MSLVMGTAGHIDHGKTSLVRAITGIDCDRLEEEKRRGITIELGFASYPLANGEYLGIVDVPGHERFVKNMVAGASGIDFVLLVVAADEGVMPQTREHLEICNLLGIRNGLVALTKTDLVDEDWLALAEEDVRAFLKGTFLEDAPVFPVSTLTGAGLEDLRQHIIRQTEHEPVRRSDLARLPVDRIFSLKGHGTVVTGTLVSGTLQVGEVLEIVPKGLETRIRSLQNHGTSEAQAHAGMRTAVNIHAVDMADIERGDVLAHPHTLFPADRWLLRLQCLASAPRPLRNRTEVHFHHGAREVGARLRFFDRDTLMPGESCLCEVRFSAPLAGVADDCCVVRAYSPLRTVAGGQIVWPFPLRLRKKNAGYVQSCETLLQLPERMPEERVLACLELCESGVSFAMLAVLTNLASRQLEKILGVLGAKNLAFCYDKEQRLYLSAPALNASMTQCMEHARQMHQREPLKRGMARGILLGALGQDAKRAYFVLERCLKSGALVPEGDGVRLAEHTVSLAADTQTLKNALLAAHEQAGMQAPNLKDVLENLHVSQKEAAPVLKILMDEKQLVKIKDGLYFHHAPVTALQNQLTAWFAEHDTLDPAGLKELTGGLSRKYIIPLLEYFDRERITIRVGDQRQLRGR